MNLSVPYETSAAVTQSRRNCAFVGATNAAGPVKRTLGHQARTT